MAKIKGYDSKQELDLTQKDINGGIENMHIYGLDHRKSQPHLIGGTVDSQTLLPVNDAVFNVKELTQIQRRLYETKEGAYMMLSTFPNNNEYSPAASHYGYDLMETAGEAQIVGTGAEANDIPFVNENVEEITTRAFEVQIGIRYTQADIERMTAIRAGTLGRGAAYSVVDKRAAAARRAIMRTVERTLLLGNEAIGIKGLADLIPATADAVNSADGVSTDVPILLNPLTTGTGSDDTAKRKFANKTGQQILDDIIVFIRSLLRGDNIFETRTIMHSVQTGTLLSKTYSDLLTGSPLKLLKEQFPNVDFIENENFSDGVLGAGNDTIVGVDMSFENVEIPIGRPYTIYPSDRDWTQVTRQLVSMRLGGVMTHYQGAFAFMRGHK